MRGHHQDVRDEKKAASKKIPAAIGNKDVQDRFRILTDLFGRKWQPIILYCLLTNGPMRFSTLQREIDNISGKVLTENLEDLVNRGFITREPNGKNPGSVEYSLTQRGRELQPLLSIAFEIATQIEKNPSQRHTAEFAATE